MRCSAEVLWPMAMSAFLVAACGTDGGPTNDNGNQNAVPVCGNGVVEAGEPCDGSDLNGATCTSIDGGFTHGELACSACTLDTSGCYVCGDGVVDPGEACDGQSFGGATCSSETGLPEGSLTCTAACEIDSTGCGLCGNGTLEGPEECDGNDLGTATCLTAAGHQEGALACGAGCLFDAAGCYTCGNGVVESAESCDGTAFGGLSCADHGFRCGALQCGAGCLSIDTSTCEPIGSEPRILFVLDGSSSMQGSFDDGIGGQTSRWEALVDAVTSALGPFGTGTHFGLMLFPGPAGGCDTGTVLVDVGIGTGPTIVQTLTSHTIPGGYTTPAGQSLMAASQYSPITGVGHLNRVVFVTDGWQYCSVVSDTRCATAAQCVAMSVSPCPTCSPDSTEYCYCVQNWPMLGAQALSAAGVSTYVIGLGDDVNVNALNATADAGGTGLPGCDPGSNQPSCYVPALNAVDLRTALANTVQEIVADSCGSTP